MISRVIKQKIKQKNNAEPKTNRVQRHAGGAYGIRTRDPNTASVVRSQLR